MLQTLHSSKYSGNELFGFSSANLRYAINNIKQCIELSLLSFMVRIEVQVWNYDENGGASVGLSSVDEDFGNFRNAICLKL